MNKKFCKLDKENVCTYIQRILNNASGIYIYYGLYFAKNSNAECWI